jgi:thioredoxin reductase (NADPH)
MTWPNSPVFPNGVLGIYPLVILPDGTPLVDPDMEELARRLGLETEPDARFYDLIVIGGGPAGLSASICGASEGLRTVVLEQEVPGGQISYSAIVENYPGFPKGMSGSDLADRTVRQADRFGVEITVLRRAVGLRQDGEDAGVYYGAATAEASACRGQDVYILGGGNSAGQAAVLLAQFARRVVILALENSIEETMSQYLVERLRKLPNVEIRTNSTVERVDGRNRLEEITIKHLKTGSTEEVRCDGLLIFVGATPRTDWLGPRSSS